MRIIVTGAANGIGAATVKRALDDGHEIIATDLDQTALEAAWSETAGVETAVLDVRDATGWQTLFEIAERNGAVDVLVNVAGVLRAGETGELDPADVELQLDINVKGVIFGSDAAARVMKPRGAGHIINVGSTASLYPTPGTTVYAASKFAVRGFSIAAAGDLEPFGIAVTLIGPTAVKTGMLEQQRGDNRAALTFSGRRALTANEVADAIISTALTKRPLELFLPSSDAWLGKLSNVSPRFFLNQAKKARSAGIKHFSHNNFSKD